MGKSIPDGHLLWLDLSTGIKIFVLVILAFVGIGHYRVQCVSQTHVDFLYNSYDHVLAQEPLPRGSWNLQFWWTFPWSSLLYIRLSILCSGIERRFFNKYINFTLLPPYNLFLGKAWVMYLRLYSRLLFFKILAFLRDGYDSIRFL